MSLQTTGADMMVIVPSRGRPDSVRAVADAFAATCRANTRLVVSIDDDDPELDAYVRTLLPGSHDDRGHSVTMYENQDLEVAVLAGGPDEPLVVIGPNKSLVQALNRAAMYCVWTTDCKSVGFMGDDSLPRTTGWDVNSLSALQELGSGLVYCNDLYQGANLPTQVTMTRDVPEALGYFCPPGFDHLLIDTVWLAWGRVSGQVTYLADTIVEHMHPMAGKGEWTEGHHRVNTSEAYQRGDRQFDLYAMTRLDSDVAIIKSLADRSRPGSSPELAAVSAP